ncbi:MAG: hypothetical protein HRT86_05250 [Ilumatobacteraceae bacterium]|nr:hypothetical protein [Ilumatobacteraceae bacterium]
MDNNNHATDCDRDDVNIDVNIVGAGARWADRGGARRIARTAPVHISDGGPHHRAARLPVVGSDRISRLFVNLAARLVERSPGSLEFDFVRINERAGLVIAIDGTPFQAFSIETVDGRVDRIYASSTQPTWVASHPLVDPPSTRSVR